MKKIIWFFLVLSIVFGSSSIVIAHPGHGHNGGSFSLLHYLGEPIHFGVGIALVGIIVAGIYWFKRNTSRTNQARKSKI